MGLALLLTLGGQSARAAESYGNCTGFITSLPATINSAGTWCFNQNLSTTISSGNAITIAADNVTIDCNDFNLDGFGAGLATLAEGIAATDRRNGTVRHCNIRGFAEGVSLGGSVGSYTVEDNRFDGITYVGLQVLGDGSVVQRNRVFDTGGSTAVPNAHAIIAVNSVDVLDNTVSGAIATAGGNGSANGIYTSSNSDGSIIGNRVRGVLKDGTGTAHGIYNDTSDRLIVRDNDLVSNGVGAALTCSNGNGRAKDNTIKGFATGITGCSNDGGNVVKP